jgi:hypothetical protein
MESMNAINREVDARSAFPWYLDLRLNKFIFVQNRIGRAFDSAIPMVEVKKTPNLLDVSYA